MDTPTIANSTSSKYVPKYRRKDSVTCDTDTSIVGTGGGMTSPIGEFKYSSSFSFARNGSPPKHFPACSILPKPGLQHNPGASNPSMSGSDTNDNGTSPLSEFKYSPSFFFAKNAGQSPPKHYAHGSPPKPTFIHRRRSSAADQSFNWRLPQPLELDEPSLAGISLNDNPNLNPAEHGILTLTCPKSITQLLYGPNGLPAGQRIVSSIGKAEQLIAFSYTNEHRQEFNDKSMRYFVEPPVGADLTRGYENWKADSEWRGGIGDLLRAVCHAKKEHGKEKGIEKETSNANKFVMPDLIAWRGNIMKIFLAPYAQHKSDSWELNAMFVNGTIYLHPHTSEERKLDRDIKHLTPELQKQTYHGFAFEKYCQSPTAPNASGRASPEPAGIDEEINVDSAEWCTVVRTTLGDMSMIVGAEIDCIKGEYTKQPDCYVELKTVHTLQDARDCYKFNKKALRYYLQSATVGIPEIIVGYRTKEGILESLETFQTAELPDYVFGQDGGWNPGLSLTWGHQVLRVLKDVMKKGPKNTHDSPAAAVWRMEFDMETSTVTIRELDGQEIEAVVNGRNYAGFLPKWYLDAMEQEE